MHPSRLPLAALVAALVSLASPTAGAQARAVIEGVFASFNRCDVEGLVAHYADGNLVFFTAGTPSPITSQAELRDYFSYLTEVPCDSPESVKHTDIELQERSLAPTAAVVHARTVVRYQQDRRALSRPFFFTFVLQDVGGRWLVVSQNAQPAADH
jgi:ketosteroid isomerase-like protein